MRCTPIVVVLFAAGLDAPALINPNFTPIDLVEQSETIVQVKLGPFDRGQKLPVRVIKTLKGDTPEGPLGIDLVQTDKPRVTELRDLFGGETTKTATMFTGDYSDAGIKRKNGCTGLSVMGVGSPGRAGILVSGASGAPALLVCGDEGSFSAREVCAVAAGEFPGAGFGDARACVVADFDGDAIADILQPFAKGALFYRGTSPGTFEAPKPVGKPQEKEVIVEGKPVRITLNAEHDAAYLNAGSRSLRMLLAPPMYRQDVTGRTAGVTIRNPY